MSEPVSTAYKSRDDVARLITLVMRATEAIEQGRSEMLCHMRMDLVEGAAEKIRSRLAAYDALARRAKAYVRWLDWPGGASHPPEYGDKIIRETASHAPAEDDNAQ